MKKKKKKTGCISQLESCNGEKEMNCNLHSCEVDGYRKCGAYDTAVEQNMREMNEKCNFFI